MENANKMQSGFQIKDMLLVESMFSRINDVSFDDKGIENNVDLNVEVGVNGNLITVAEEVTVKQKFQDLEQVNIKVKMVGIFEIVGEPSIENAEEFGKINGAAIIFPYIREHITNLSLKSGIPVIILPPINFTKM